MSGVLHSITRTLPTLGPRRAFLQGAALLLLLWPSAALLSYLVANYAGAAMPEAAAALTAMIGAFGCIMVLSGLFQQETYPHARLGLCNAITLTRGAGIAVLFGLLLTPVETLGWWIPVFALTLLMLDGLDGWAARHAKLQSAFGARMDVETDVAFALALAALAVALGHVGAWFLLLGLLRPLFLLASHFLPALRHPLPDARWRKRMAGLQMTVQVVLVSPLVAPPFSALLGAALLAGMLFSFAIDIRWLIRRARSP